MGMPYTLCVRYALAGILNECASVSSARQILTLFSSMYCAVDVGLTMIVRLFRARCASVQNMRVLYNQTVFGAFCLETLGVPIYKIIT